MTTRRTLLKSITPLVAGAGMLLSATMAFAQDTMPIRIAVDSFTSGTQIWVAEDQGYFEDFGVDTTIIQFGSGIEALDAVLTGRADIAVGLDFPTAMRMQSGEVRLLSSVFYSQPGWHKLVVNNEIQSIEDLRGGTLAVIQGTAQHLVTERMLELNGIGADEVEIISLTSVLELVAAVRGGRADGSFLWADAVDRTIESGSHSILVDDSVANVNQYAYLSANDAFLQENEATLVAVLGALDQATDFIHNDVDAAAEIMGNYTSAPLELLKILIEGNNFHLRLGEEEREAFAVIGDFASEIVDGDITFDDAVAPGPLREALPETVTLAN